MRPQLLLTFKRKMNVKKLVLFSLIVVLFCADTLAVYGQTMAEYELKSGFLYRICKYTQWPTPPGPDKPFIISILGKIPGGQEIHIPPANTIAGRKIVTRKIEQPAGIDGSDVLFIASSEANRLEAILDYTAGKPILTVGDTRGFAQRGVMVNYYIQNDRVRFEINYEACKNASLQMHSQLFAIGRVVKTREPL